MGTCTLINFMSYVRHFNSKRGPSLRLSRIRPIAPGPNARRHALPELGLVSSVTFCGGLCAVKIYAAARMQESWTLAGILFYFICINHVAGDAIEKYICLLGNFASSLIAARHRCTECRTHTHIHPHTLCVQGHAVQQDEHQQQQKQSSWQVHTFRFGC